MKELQTAVSAEQTLVPKQQDWEKQGGLIPAVVQNGETNEILIDRNRAKSEQGAISVSGCRSKEAVMSELIDIAQSAEYILVPKSLDAIFGVGTFTKMTGIEIPTDLREKMISRSQGRTFRLVPGRDIPSQLAVGWGDVGIASTELTAEYGNMTRIGAFRIGESFCRYSILGIEPKASQIEDDLNRMSRYPIRTWVIPATFPRFLGQIAAARDLPVLALDVPVSGQGEATMLASNMGVMAERVVTGNTATKLNAREVFKLADIYPELLYRKEQS